MILFAGEHVFPIVFIGLDELVELFLEKDELTIDFVVLCCCDIVLEYF